MLKIMTVSDLERMFSLLKEQIYLFIYVLEGKLDIAGKLCIHLLLWLCCMCVVGCKGNREALLCPGVSQWIWSVLAVPPSFPTHLAPVISLFSLLLLQAFLVRLLENR